MMIPENATFSNLEVDVTQLPRAEEMSYVPLSPLYIKVMRLEYFFYYLLLIGVVWGTHFFYTDTVFRWWLPSLLTLVLLVLAGINQLWIKKAFAFRGYALREQDITYRKGLFIHRYTTLCMCRMQQITVKQGWLSRWIGIYELEMEDASQSSHGITIPGLTQDMAEQLKSYLLKGIQQHGK